jgi:hypothetical protein
LKEVDGGSFECLFAKSPGSPCCYKVNEAASESKSDRPVVDAFRSFGVICCKRHKNQLHTYVVERIPKEDEKRRKTLIASDKHEWQDASDVTLQALKKRISMFAEPLTDGGESAWRAAEFLQAFKPNQPRKSKGRAKDDDELAIFRQQLAASQAAQAKLEAELAATRTAAATGQGQNKARKRSAADEGDEREKEEVEKEAAAQRKRKKKMRR